ncbi:MAG TPA: OmpA family protein [Candidatus Hydrogenedentes bacterium]|nr:OmpA family protein [Candidatus Hydrogenedentota bacterium]HIJ73593.1 OmpA family protein [Candidatus Hydrogenedentota bacterium]
MRKMLVCMLGVALVGMAGSAMAQCKGKGWDDLSWWAQSGATPAPVKDTTRSGYWWWPTEPASNVDDSELWGNRGVVYNTLVEPAPERPPQEGPAPEGPIRVIPTLSCVLFDFDKAVVKPEGMAVVNQVVALMKEHRDDTVIVEGHTCNIGTEEYNMGLGQRRADAVQKCLVDGGIGPGRITTKSYGESQPAVANDTPANRKLNRRVVFKIIMGD